MWVSVIMFAILVGSWILFELYGRPAFALLTGWSMWVRIVCGVLAIAYVFFQEPAQLKETLAFAQQIVLDGGGSNSNSKNGTLEKRNVSGLLKKKIAAGQSWKCGTCGSLLDETYEVDHRLALFKGGTNDPANLVALCPNCHRKKTVEERL